MRFNNKNGHYLFLKKMVFLTLYGAWIRPNHWSRFRLKGSVPLFAVMSLSANIQERHVNLELTGHKHTVTVV